jgi:hypothetical protein
MAAYYNGYIGLPYLPIIMAAEVLPYLPIIIARKGPTYLTVIMA